MNQKQKNQMSSQRKGRTTEQQQNLGLQTLVEVCTTILIIKIVFHFNFVKLRSQVYTILRLIIDYKRFVAIATTYFGSQRFYSFILST